MTRNTDRAFDIITCELPKTITFGNKENITLVTSTARAIDCLEVLADQVLTDEMKRLYCFDRLLIASPELTKKYKEEIWAYLLNYLKGPDVEQYEKANLPRSEEPIIYWALDAQAIAASFRQAYGISLEELRSMHFWEFSVLLSNIPGDTAIGRLFATRMSTEDPKMPPEQKTRQREVKKAARPKDKRSLEEKEAAFQQDLAAALD